MLSILDVYLTNLLCYKNIENDLSRSYLNVRLLEYAYYELKWIFELNKNTVCICSWIKDSVVVILCCSSSRRHWRVTNSSLLSTGLTDRYDCNIKFGCCVQGLLVQLEGVDLAWLHRVMTLQHDGTGLMMLKMTWCNSSRYCARIQRDTRVGRIFPLSIVVVVKFRIECCWKSKLETIKNHWQKSENRKKCLLVLIVYFGLRTYDASHHQILDP